jgi:16S rRNA (uracil1498-N3)-methyltransferase
MTRRRWIADEVSGNRAALVGAHADHLVRVLRTRVGEEFDIVTEATVRRGRVTSLADGRVEFELAEEVSAPRLPVVTIVLAIFKFDRMEWAIEKCTELGVSRIIPLISSRTDSHLAAASAKRVERWQRIALQASEQSRRTSPPEITSPLKLSQALAVADGTRILLSESEENTLFRDALDLADPQAGIVLAIGPEGGWTENELQSFREGGWIAASLGNTILRAETAAIAATAIAISALSSF